MAGHKEAAGDLAPRHDLRAWLRARQGAPAPPAASPRRAVSIAVGRAAQRACGLAVLPGAVELPRVTLAEIPDLLPTQPLLIVVEGSGERLGLVALCRSLVAAIIEMNSMGRVSPAEPRERRPTRTDAAICAEFVNAALCELGVELAAVAPGLGAESYRYASFIEDPGPVELMLDDAAYRAVDFTMRVGKGGLREARLFVMLPEPAEALGLPMAGKARHTDAGQSAPARPNLAAALRAAPLDLGAVLHRQQATLGQLRRIAAEGGDLALHGAALEMVRIEAADGSVLFNARLGELRGAPALRVLAQGASTNEAAIDGAPGALAVSANLFAAEPDLPQSAAAPFDLCAMDEPPMEDLAAPDPFRSPADEASEADPDAEPAPLAMRMIID
ncbi:MAG: hypothetical protein Q4F71_10125 [Paracoccus sp. (in: a-proteobacteria)]|nr:hypothetical protein [Paracoccus sp. (in: a-proteobacteria)]